MKPGETLPTLERTISIVDMVAYAGATWDWHRLHYDQAFVSEGNLEAPVVDGQMLGALMAEQILDGLGPAAFIRTMAFRFTSMVFAGEAVRVEGEVTDAGDGHVAIAQRVLVGERLAAEGTARVRV